jgi:hypothetical protein
LVYETRVQGRVDFKRGVASGQLGMRTVIENEIGIIIGWNIGVSISAYAIV